MNNKFTIELVWHNCKTHPPKEDRNDYLYVSDGEFVNSVKYSKDKGWFVREVGSYLSIDVLNEYWWADIEQTVQGDFRFRE
jgi:hypothetical protein